MLKSEIRSMRPFLVCIHDASPAYAAETRVIINDLTPLIGRRLSFAVVPDWHGKWPLAAHPDYCRMIQHSSDELLLHGYNHRRNRGWGPATLLTDGCDEMNGLSREETRRMIERGQAVFIDAFGKSARGFIPPGWQRGHLRSAKANDTGVDHILGFSNLESSDGQRIPLATWTWDCSRWGWTGHIGSGIGWLLQSLDRGVPTLAIHPKDLHRGFWPGIIDLTRRLLDNGYEPTTLSGLLQA